MAFGVTNLFPDDSTAANFREWCQWIHDSFVAAGWIQTADTGQITIASAAAPTTYNQVIGYEVWRMNDALHVVGFPVYCRVAYGSNSTGSGAHNVTAQFDVGFSTDGAGNIASISKVYSIWQNGNWQLDPPLKTAATRYACYFSGGTNRILFHPFEGTANPSVTPFISIERTKNDDGTDNADGVIALTHQLAINPGSSNYAWSQQLALRADPAAHPLITGGSGSGSEKGFAITNGSLLYGANVNPLPWLIASKRGYENPPRNVATYFSSEVADGSILDVNMYGLVQKMRTPAGCLRNAAMALSFASVNQVTNTALMYRYGD